MRIADIQRFERNTKGRDLAIGDIHGHFQLLFAELQNIGFDPSVDRLFSVGDLVDRGPDSADADDWLGRPWFHAVRGNHEQMAIDAVQGFYDPYMYAANGGTWFMALPKDHQRLIADSFEAMPHAIEVETANGLVGLVHADVPVADWNDLADALSGHNADAYKMRCLWDRDRITKELRHEVAGVRAVIVGHTPVKRATVLGNVYFIDTGAWLRGGHFTFIDLATLQTIPPMAKPLEWEAA
jgi:serine/threonine protein phosphatase 1